MEPSGTANDAPSTALHAAEALGQVLTSSSAPVGATRCGRRAATRSVIEARLPPVPMRAPTSPALPRGPAPASAADSTAGSTPLGRRITTSDEQTAEEQQPDVAAAAVVVGHLVERLDR